ncbi:hypothetical protein GCM10027429_01700 [Marivirga atlantica]|uniref:DnaJ domain-containing protein n=1 Tax=Marivirga atlantica TaxID=1548457 RepID=A0A937AJD4_9BACT|nr:DnaJ domain-containing protein [Marivirga atlantica]MBL0763782.1 DnaJ domain-containing protein [Marivirga atlantica]
MSNYYQILGITENANLAEIKSAYKRLAKQYHPDLNPSPVAEDEFKKISVAYRVLSNTISRSKYDSQLAQNRLDEMRTYTRNTSRSDYQNPYKRPVYKYSPRRTVYDRKTERKATLYAVAMIASVALIVYLGATIFNYYQSHMKQRLVDSFDKQAATADSLFYAGKDEAALVFVKKMSIEVSQQKGLSNYEYDYLKFRRKQADIDFKNRAYQDAVWGYLFYMEYTQKQEEDMVYKLAICYKQLGEFGKSVFILNELLNKNYRRFHTLALIADIYKNDLGNIPVALQYYEMGLANIENTYKTTYGDAYRLLVTAENTPNVYKQIYFESAKIYFSQEDYQEARKLLEWVVFFSPQQAEGYEYLYKTYNRLDQPKQACAVARKAKRKNVQLSEEMKNNCNV